jgi:hypothetical protein
MLAELREIEFAEEPPKTISGKCSATGIATVRTPGVPSHRKRASARIAVGTSGTA